MSRIHISPRAAFLWCLSALILFALSGCGDNEPEERQAFSTFLNEKILHSKGVAIPRLSRDEAKPFGDYAKHYALLVDFQQSLSEKAGKARHILKTADTAELATYANNVAALEKSAREARSLNKVALRLLEKTDSAKKALALPEDLATAYNAAYEKIVTRPAESFAALALAAAESFDASIDILEFVDDRNRDITIEHGEYVIYNTAIEPEFRIKEAVEKEKAAALEKAYAALVQTMTQ